MSMTAEEIKALPRTSEGIFDLSGLGEDVYTTAAVVYPIYAAYETEVNKKEGYPDIMAQMRVWNEKVNEEFTFENASAYVSMLIFTIKKISPEIYENYRELVDMFREAVKRALTEYYAADKKNFVGVDQADVDTFCSAVREACSLDLLLAEKYQMCF
ncbi:MAG: hypothetical protein NC417_05030 [Candidatus Gastranaerophilales bacterium]|nr:hypothetical protein [Candidatus Gastranaerophilales bacterium]